MAKEFKLSPERWKELKDELVYLKTVRLGSKLKVLDVEFNEELDYEVVGSQEADPMNGRISEDSPFGKALLGKAIGDEVQVEAPAGVLRYRILEIQK